MTKSDPTVIDVIILSYAVNDHLLRMTHHTIESLLSSEDETQVRFNVVVIESNRTLGEYKYPSSETVYPEARFGYNRYLNIGVKRTGNEFICLANNDLTFHKGWATAILDAARANPGVLSFSPVDPWLHRQLGMEGMPEVVLGYEKMKHVTGWCFVVRRQIFDQIGDFDENLEFWYVDDDYIKTLEKYNIAHALVRDSRVDHLSGKTIQGDGMSKAAQTRLTTKQWLYYDFKWNHNSRLIYFAKSVLFHVRALVVQGNPWIRQNRSK